MGARFLFYFRYFSLFFSLSATLAHGESTFGRFVGVLRHQSMKQEQLAKLDFIVSRGEGENLELKAILTLHFGDFSSGEYVSYNFDRVHYNLIQRTLIFDQPDQDLTIVTTRFEKGEFVGQVRSTFGDNFGTLLLKKDLPAEPSLPLVEPIWGRYQGFCNGGSTHLQLYTFRSTKKSDEVGNLFAAYEIRGQFAKNPNFCPASGNPFGWPCVTNYIYGGSYNFFKNSLKLLGRRNNLDCIVDSKGMTCNQCRLDRISQETNPPRNLKPLQSPATFFSVADAPPQDEPALKGPVPSLGGKYTGYLHHEFLDLYQPGSLDLIAFQTGATGESLHLSSVATLHFGDPESNESLAYRFNERVFPLLNPQFVFERAEAGVDAFLQVTSIGNGVVKGNWYSTLFGRVGQFEFRKDGLPEPGSGRIMQAVGGRYLNRYFQYYWDLNEIVATGAESPNTVNPFFPLTFSGYLWEKHFLFPKVGLRGGSYDFYTGRIALHLNDGETVILGQRTSRNELLLKGLVDRVGIPMEKHELRSFVYTTTVRP